MSPREPSARIVMCIEIFYTTSQPTVGVRRLGWEREQAAETEKNPKPRKLPKNAVRTPSRLHAVLGRAVVIQEHAAQSINSEEGAFP